MPDGPNAARKGNRVSQELDAVRDMVREMTQDIAALRAELGPAARAPAVEAAWPSAASAHASQPTVPRV